MSDGRQAYICACDVAFYEGGVCEKCGVWRTYVGRVVGGTLIYDTPEAFTKAFAVAGFIDDPDDDSGISGR